MLESKKYRFYTFDHFNKKVLYCANQAMTLTKFEDLKSALAFEQKNEDVKICLFETFDDMINFIQNDKR